MKVILLQQVLHLGNPGDVKDVSEGYFRNFLLPKKMAEVAAPSRVAQIQKGVEKRKKEQEAKLETLKQTIRKTGQIELSLSAKADATGSLYAAVKPKDILEKLREAGLDVPEDALTIKEHIKTVGLHEVLLKAAEVEATLKLKVEPSLK